MSLPDRLLFTEDKQTICKYISPYLTKDTETIVYKETSTPKGLPKLCFGCMPYDNGNLLMDLAEYKEFVEYYPNDAHYIRKKIIVPSTSSEA